MLHTIVHKNMERLLGQPTKSIQMQDLFGMNQNCYRLYKNSTESILHNQDKAKRKTFNLFLIELKANQF